MTRQVWFIADDYGFAPGISDGILELIGLGRLSGTGCMPLYADWPEQAARLKTVAGKAAIGLHLTLTDQPALAGPSALAPQGKLPTLAALVTGSTSGRIDDKSLHAEIDAQYARFTEATGAPPAYLDGHQHVHFLPPVRRWLTGLAARGGSLPWLRGAPTRPSVSTASPAKVAVARALAGRFDAQMRRAGFEIRGPLSGFYDWSRPELFAGTVSRALGSMTDGALFMCHPGHADDILRTRDPFTDGRGTELSFLASRQFEDLLDSHDAAVARP